MPRQTRSSKPRIETVQSVKSERSSSSDSHEDQPMIKVNLPPSDQVAMVPYRSLPSAQKPQDSLTVHIPHQMPAHLTPPTLQNLVSTADLGTKIDLQKLAQWCRNAEYNPARFSAVVMRIREPKVTGLIFSTGKIVITGAKSERASMTAAKIFEKAVMKVQGSEEGDQSNSESGNPCLSNFKIQNIVASSDVGFSIKLESLQEEHKKFSRCHYEPELFPGLIYKMESPKVVLLIFTSGKIVLAGAKTR